MPTRNRAKLQLRAGLLQRKVLSVPRNRIRSVQTDARLLHRLMGLAVVRVSTGQEAKGENGSGVFELNAVRVDEVPRLRAILLADSAQQVDARDRGAVDGTERGAGALAAVLVAVFAVECVRPAVAGRRGRRGVRERIRWAAAAFAAGRVGARRRPAAR